MSYKTITVHLHDEAGTARVLEPAIALAQRFGARLIGLHVSPGLIYVPTAPGASGVVGRINQQERLVCERITTTFEEMTKGASFVAELRLLKPRGRDDIGALVQQHSRAADLIVASQREPQLEISNMLGFPERLVMESGRPVLTVPLAGERSLLNRHVLIAWNGKREAARAVFDALPLLKAARKVTVLCAEQTDAEGTSTPLPDTSIAAALARHDVSVTLKTAIVDKSAVGATIAAAIAAEHVDLAVMGAYGHSRLREFVFGGATRHLLQHMTVPVLFSH